MKKTYRQRVNFTSRLTTVILAVLVIVWGALVGQGYAFGGVLTLTALVMFACLAVALTTRERASA